MADTYNALGLPQGKQPTALPGSAYAQGSAAQASQTTAQQAAQGGAGAGGWTTGYMGPAQTPDQQAAAAAQFQQQYGGGQGTVSFGTPQPGPSQYTSTTGAPAAQAPPVSSGGVNPYGTPENGGVRLANGSWVPLDHPSAAQYNAYANGGTTGTGAAPGPLPSTQGGVNGYPDLQYGYISNTQGQVNTNTPAARQAPAPAQVQAQQQWQGTAQTPQYQTYNYSAQPAMLSPTSVKSYQAGTIDQFQPSSQTTALNGLATQLANQAAGSATVPTAALKESAKETLLSQKQQALDQSNQSAAQRGTSGSGVQDALAQNANDSFAGNLTGAYRDIDQNAAETNFNNLLAALTGVSGLSNTLTGQAQSNYATGLSGQNAQEAANQADAASSQAAGAYGLSRDQVAGSQNLAYQQAQAAENANKNAFGLSAAQLASQNDQNKNNFNLTAQQQLIQQLQNNQSQAQNNYQFQASNDLATQLGLGQLGIQQQGANLANQNAALNEYLQRGQLAQGSQSLANQLQLGNSSLDLQKLLGMGGLNLDASKLAEQKDEFGQTLNQNGNIAAMNNNSSYISQLLALLQGGGS